MTAGERILLIAAAAAMVFMMVAALVVDIPNLNRVGALLYAGGHLALVAWLWYLPGSKGRQ